MLVSIHMSYKANLTYLDLFHVLENTVLVLAGLPDDEDKTFIVLDDQVILLVFKQLHNLLLVVIRLQLQGHDDGALARVVFARRVVQTFYAVSSHVGNISELRLIVSGYVGSEI